MRSKTQKPPVAVPNTHDTTRQALLAAAGEIFAETGFHASTIRSISNHARANVAAIHYHFGDKETLYLEVLRFAQTYALSKYPADMGISAQASPEEKLKAFVRAFLLRIFDKGPFAWHARLIAREMIDPTPALNTVVKEKILPQSRQLMGIVAELLHADPTDKRVRNCAMSVVSQALFYHHCRPVVERLFPRMKFSASEIEALAVHITRFSIGGMETMRTSKRR